MEDVLLIAPESEVILPANVETTTKPECRTKQFRFVVKEVSDDGTFEGYASVWGIRDSDDEVVDKGSTSRSLKNNKNFVLLWQHKTDHPIGFAVDATEDDYGLKLKGKLALDCDPAKHAYAMLKLAKEVGGTAKMGLSIGFMVIRDQWVKDEKTGKSFRHFVEIKLMETSIVTFPANPESWVSEVKGRLEAKTASSLHEEKTMTTTNTMPDFDANLEAAKRQRELRKDRNDIDNALYDTLSAIHGSDGSDEEKQTAIRSTYMKHAKAMGDWHCQSFFGSGSSKAFDISILTKSNDEALAAAGKKAGEADAFTYKGKKVSAAMKANLQHALDMHCSAIDMHNKGMKVVKDMFDDGGGDSDADTEMGAMASALATTVKASAIETKSFIEWAAKNQDAFTAALTAAYTAGTTEKTNSTETNNAAATQGVGSNSANSSDSGTHSLADDLKALSEGFLEKYK